MAFTAITVTRRYLTAEFTPATGTVRFTPTAPMVNGDTVVAASRVGTLDAEGDLTLIVAANNDPATTPTPVSYEVREDITGQPTRTYYVVVPYNAAAGTVALSTLNVAAAPPVVTYPAPGPQGIQGVPGPNTIATASDLTKAGAVGGLMSVATVSGANAAGFKLLAPLWYVNVRDYGATGVSGQDQTAALVAARDAAVAGGRALYLPTGTYDHTGGFDLRYDALHVFGDGRDKTIIRITGSNVAGILVGRFKQTMHDFRVAYATPQTAADTNSTAVEFYKAIWSDYRRIAAYDSARGFGIAQVHYDAGPGSTTNNYVFSCVFESLTASRFAITGLRMDCFGGRGTGNVFTNIYLNNKTAADARGACTGPVASWVNMTELAVTQLNMEHVIPGGSTAVTVTSCPAPVFDSVHIEGLTMNVANSALFRLFDGVRLTLSGLNFSFSTVDSVGGGSKSWFSLGNGCHLDLSGGHQESITVTNPAYSLVNLDAASTTGLVYARATDTSAFTATAAGDTASIRARVRDINDTVADTRTQIYISAGTLRATTPTNPSEVTVGNGGQMGGWGLDQTANETVVTSLRLPPTWNTYNIVVRGGNFATGVGDVSLRESHGAVGVSDNGATGFTTGLVVTFAAGAIGIIQEATLATGIAANPAKETVVSVSRRAADVTDTLANDWVLTGMILVQAS